MAVQKKNIPLYILEILKTYSDEEHRLNQKNIIEKLKQKYDIKVDRKTVKRNIELLMECGYNINYSSCVRKTKMKDGTTEEYPVLSDYYLERDFSESELRFLIDSLLFSTHIPPKQKNDLLQKLIKLSSSYFTERMQYVKTIRTKEESNKQFFYNVEMLSEAIQKNIQVSFQYCHYSTDKKLHPVIKDGRPKSFLINPYYLVSVNGKYYLVCNYDKYDDISNFRLDRIKDIKLLNSQAKPIRSLKRLKNGFDLQTYMENELYMFSGEAVTVTFRAEKFLLDDIMGAFGGTITFLDESEDDVLARVTVNDEAFIHWALQYSDSVKIESPGPLKDRIVSEVRKSLALYEKN